MVFTETTMKKLILCLSISFVFSSGLRAQTSHIITYQGAIASATGASVRDSIYPIAVTLWTDSAGGTALWRDVFETPVKNGIFNIALGSQKLLPAPAAMDRALWFGVSFNGGVEARTPVGSVPTAINVADSSITTAKLADRSVTWNKMGAEYIPYIRVNGAKVSTGQNPINFTGGNGLRVDFDTSSMSVIIQPDSTTQVLHGSKGATPQFVATNPCGTNSSGSNADSVYNTVSGGCSNNATATNGYATVGGGQSNKATSTWATVAGGDTNIAQGKLAFIGGGFLNTVSGDTSVIVGGDHNEIDQDGSVSFIGAGFHNLIQPGLTGLGQLGSSIVSGFNNTIYNFTSFIGAGVANRIGSGGDLERQDTIVPPYAGDAASAIVAGDSNFIDEGLGFIGGGALNSIYGGYPDPNFSVIVGGYHNTVRALYSGILGGTFDTVWLGSYFTAIAGGDSNFANGNSDFIGAGAGNEERGTGIFIGAGTYNEVGLSPLNPTGTSSSYSFIGDGERNSIDGAYSDHNVIVGGLRDSIIGGYNYLGFIGAGEGNVITGPFDTASFIGGGALNRIDSESSLSAIAGGESNYISAPYCFIGGGGGPASGGTTNDLIYPTQVFHAIHAARKWQSCS